MSSAQQPRGWNTVVTSSASRRGRIVFHADDFGMNRAVTDGILRGIEHGLITGTSLLANAPDATRAIREWQRLQQAREVGRLPSAAIRRELDEPETPFELGIHINLTQGRPLTSGYPTESACREALAQVKPVRIPSNAMRNVGEIMDARCFPAPAPK